MRNISADGESDPSAPSFSALFESYWLDDAYDEMFAAQGVPRVAYGELNRQLLEMQAHELDRRQAAADLAFLNQGITFTVYGSDEGMERIWPYDLLPRIITGAEWDTIERGLSQRITALNLFLKDIYHDARILADGIVPRHLVYSCRHFRREMRGIQVPGDVYISVVGSDLVRLPDGRFAVLEDNLRVPSGVSYMLVNRQVMKRVFSLLFASYDVCSIDHYSQALLATLQRLAPPGVARSEHRPAHAGRLQLGLLRARLSRPADGDRTGGGTRSPHP